MKFTYTFLVCSPLVIYQLYSNLSYTTFNNNFQLRRVEEGDAAEREEVEREEVEREEAEREETEREEAAREEATREEAAREEAAREEREEEDWDSELEREAIALARWRRPEGFGERRRQEEEQVEAGWFCCGRRVVGVRGRGRGRGGRGRGRGRGIGEEEGLEALQQARHDILLTTRTYI